MHHRRWTRTGTVHRPPPKPDYKVATTGCWLWQKNLRNGYGRIWRDGKLHSAHVWYWQQEHGAVPAGLELDHLCRNRACVNPAHLEPVRRDENVRRGSLTKLTQEQVDEIRAVEPYWGYRRDLAKKYGVSVPLIAKIRSGECWK